MSFPEERYEDQGYQGNTAVTDVDAVPNRDESLDEAAAARSGTVTRDATDAPVTAAENDDETRRTAEPADRSITGPDSADQGGTGAGSAGRTSGAGSDAPIYQETATSQESFTDESLTDENLTAPVVVAEPPIGAAGTVGGASVSGSQEALADWQSLQGKFVDDPAAACKEAADLVESAVARLRGQLDTGSTEDLRVAFRRYRDLYAGLR